MIVDIELTENDLRALVLVEIQRRLGDIPLKTSDVQIEVKSKQNYRAHEWESGAFRARLKVSV